PVDSFRKLIFHHCLCAVHFNRSNHSSSAGVKIDERLIILVFYNGNGVYASAFLSGFNLNCKVDGTCAKTAQRILIGPFVVRNIIQRRDETVLHLRAIFILQQIEEVFRAVGEFAEVGRKFSFQEDLDLKFVIKRAHQIPGGFAERITFFPREVDSRVCQGGKEIDTDQQHQEVKPAKLRFQYGTGESAHLFNRFLFVSVRNRKITERK